MSDPSQLERQRLTRRADLVSPFLGMTSSTATAPSQLSNPCKKQICVVKYSNL